MSAWRLVFGAVAFGALFAALVFLFWGTIASADEPNRQEVAAMALIGWFVLALGVSYAFLAAAPARNRAVAYPALVIWSGMALHHLPQVLPIALLGGQQVPLLSVLFAGVALIHLVFLFSVRRGD